MSAKNFTLGAIFFLYLLGLFALIEQIRPRGEFFELTQRIQQQGAPAALERWRSR